VGVRPGGRGGGGPRTAEVTGDEIVAMITGSAVAR
jgi:hypothetical protein